MRSKAEFAPIVGASKVEEGANMLRVLAANKINVVWAAWMMHAGYYRLYIVVDKNAPHIPQLCDIMMCHGLDLFDVYLGKSDDFRYAQLSKSLLSLPSGQNFSTLVVCGHDEDVSYKWPFIYDWPAIRSAELAGKGGG